MKRSKKIEQISSVEKLEYIKTMISSIGEERIIAAVNSIRKDEAICKLMRVFSDFNNSFAEEEERLMEDMQEHNKKYANKDNDKYTTAYKALSCIKHCAMGLYSIINAFTPRTYQPYYNKADTKNIEWKLNHSYLIHLPCEGYMFDNMTPSQKRLVSEISGFLNYTDRNLERCKLIVDEEERIGNNQEECLVRLEKQIDELYQIVYEKKYYSIDDDYYRDLLDVDEHPENAKKYFHRLKPKQLVYVALGMLEKKLKDYSSLERKVFNNNPEMIDNFRKAVAYIMKSSKKITARTIVYLQRYLKSSATQRSFHKCFEECYSRIGGNQKIVSYAQFNNAYTQYGHEETDAYRDFNKKMDLAMLTNLKA